MTVECSSWEHSGHPIFLSSDSFHSKACFNRPLKLPARHPILLGGRVSRTYPYRVSVSDMKNRLKALWSSKISAGVLASYFNTGASIACNFIVVPVYLKYLGSQEYGLWLTISGLVGYLSLLNLGISQTTANYFGSAAARDDRREQNRVLSTGFWFYVSIVACAPAALMVL